MTFKKLALLFGVAILPALHASAQQQIGAIATPQINSTFYVGTITGFYPSIQSAVNAACATSGAAVDIPAGATPSDTIAAVTGGCTTVGIIDHRVVPSVSYTWSGSAYIAVSSGGAVSSLTTTGISGPASLNSGVMNIPNYTPAGVTIQIPSGVSTVTLTPVQAANHVLNITSAATLTGAVTIVVPLNLGQDYIVQNKTTGIQFITIVGPTGGGVNIGEGSSAQVFSDGISYIQSAVGTGANNLWSGSQNFRATVVISTGQNASPTLNAPSPALIFASSVCAVAGCSGASNDLWQIVPVVGAGLNASTTLTLSHTGGSTGPAVVSLPTGSQVGASPICTTATGCGTGGLPLTAALLKGNNSGGAVAATVGVDYASGSEPIGAAAQVTANAALPKIGTVIPRQIPPFEGTVVPVFHTVASFDNLGAALGNPFCLATRGGLVACTQGTVASGYRRLPREANTSRVTRTDWQVIWDPTDTTGTMTLGIGLSTGKYLVTLSNTASGTMQAVFASNGAGTTTTVSGVVGTSPLTLTVSVVTGNGGVTVSVLPQGAQLPLTAPDPWLTYQAVWQMMLQPRVTVAYFSNSSATSKIMGWLHNSNGLDGDPNGVLLTRTATRNLAGAPLSTLPAAAVSSNTNHENVIIIPERANPSIPLKSVMMFHGRSGYGPNDFCQVPGTSTPAEPADTTCVQLLAAGYAVVIDQGGHSFNNSQADYWGNMRGTTYAKETLDALTKHIFNPGKTYALGQSMGGVGSLNFIRQYPNVIAAAYEATPAIDLNETACPLGINCAGGTLQATLNSTYYTTYVSAAPIVTLTLSAAATASGGSTVYTGTITNGASNSFAGLTFTVAGFTTATNNGAFVATASTATTLTMSNAAGVAETHAGTAASSNVGNNPATDSGANWAVLAEAGALPDVGGTSWQQTMVAAAVTNSSQVTMTTPTQGNAGGIVPGDYVYFEGAAQLRRVQYRATGLATTLVLDSPVTVAAGDLVNIIRKLPNGSPDPNSMNFIWANILTAGPASWVVGTTYALAQYVQSPSSNIFNDEAAWNPLRSPESFGTTPIDIGIGGDGTCTGNDGILNNAQMCSFGVAVNAVYPGMVTNTFYVGSNGSGHVSQAMVPANILAFFAAH